MRHLTTPLLATAMSVLSSAPTHADLGDELAKLLPDDGAFDDHFGKSVAISGANVVVGSPHDDDNGDKSGSAYLFDTDVTAGGQLFKLLPNDGAADDRFGVSVAISGDVAIVGAWRDDDNGNESGSAYLFDTTTGNQLFKLLPNDGAADDRFGLSVAISGTIAIVGARHDDDNGTDSGAAYLFDITTGLQLAKLLPDDGVAGDSFGRVTIGGAAGDEIAIVGAPRVNDDSGAAYVFDISNPTRPTQLFKLLPKDGAVNDWFGWSVAFEGATAIVGAPLDDDNGFYSGSAYLFDITTGLQLAKLLADDGATDENFGYSVAMNGDSENDIAIIGAIWDNDNGLFGGSAYFFDPTTGRQLAKVLASDGQSFDSFGISVGISGTTAIVGAELDDHEPFGPGAAYIFDATYCPWDLEGNGVVDLSDLLALLASWGSCKGCPADFDGDDTVGLSDLLLLLANWGPCP